jgi:hypothetical protein
METPDLRAGLPAGPKGTPVHKTRFAAELCRRFMEDQGWEQVFAIARGEPQRALVRHGFSGKVQEVKITPDLDQRLTAYKFVTSYGYGRPAELADPDSGRTVTDLLLQALRPSGSHEAGAE